MASNGLVMIIHGGLNGKQWADVHHTGWPEWQAMVWCCSYMVA